MTPKNARLVGMLIVLALVVIAMLYFSQANRPKPARPGLDNVPPLGQLPSQDQIENRPPTKK